MQRPHWKENQFGGVPNSKYPNAGRGIDRFDKSKDDKDNSYLDKKLNDSKKVDPKKSQGPSRDDSSPKRGREDDNAQLRKKVKTTEVCSNPISELGQNILKMLKSVYNSVFGSKKD
ncbi:hypothetical protein BMR1_01G00920 [Babesia microti strain RI]|uniref:Uncharacterized protein n=1 Tax=Babesia microti (strain RI) TaxID=1133968 RepID=I7IFA9_BABMR|nr:hypothetical protein BMR1_01G00920 [Babesia microti strain RI]CCF72646.1 hypothetical protein BMR1_01G00920 [Babesia microti strain RI]|eukprot:XP_012647255.1 hypothetical protein BMR1_01G00920 [Babesia microti strain RI]